jgi:hypothetical protein
MAGLFVRMRIFSSWLVSLLVLFLFPTDVIDEIYGTFNACSQKIPRDLR